MSCWKSEFTYDLPPELIAQEPLAERRASRLLVVDPADGRIEHRTFTDLVALLHPGDLLVLNDTGVIPARLHAVKDSGGQAEILIERIESEHVAECHVRVSKPLKPGRTLTLASGAELRVLGRSGELYRLEFPEDVRAMLDREGEVPLPPYISRAPAPSDAARYQTVYARHEGAVAAPTAGLHFDVPLLEQLGRTGIGSTYVTLHVGAGTFQPVRAEDLGMHRLHRERVRVPRETIERIEQTRRDGGRVVAVGTTVVRALESAAANGALEPLDGETELFILPGFRFRVIDVLLTNFHLPESTLLMLVAAFAGRERVLAAYAEAVRERYRFFSYGDAMLILRPASGGDA